MFFTIPLLILCISVILKSYLLLFNNNESKRQNIYIMKRKLTFFYLLIFTAFLGAGPARITAQTVSTTVHYTGFQACGGCTVCGSDYWCFNTAAGNYCGPATSACGTNSFMDPVPP